MKIVLAYEHIRRLRGTHGEWVTAIGQGLAARGHDVHIVCDSVADAELCSELTFHARRPFVKGDSHRLLVLRAWAIGQLRKLAADICISFHAALPAEIVFPIDGFVQTRLAREIRQHRNPFWGMCLQLYPPVNERRLVEALLRHDRKRVALIGATSRLMRDTLLERFPKLEDRLRLVPGAAPCEPGEDVAAVRAMREEVRQELGMAQDDVMFLWASTRIGWHGGGCLLEAFGKATSGSGSGLARAKLVMASEGQWTLHRWAAKHRCLERVRVVGRTNAMARLLAACDVGVNPAIYSHLGRFTWECLAFGKPVIASAYTAGIDRMQVADQRPAGRVVRPYDVDTLRIAITQMLDDSMREAARKAAERLAATMKFSLFLDRLEDFIFVRRGLPIPQREITNELAPNGAQRAAKSAGTTERIADAVGGEGRLPFALTSISAARVENKSTELADDGGESPASAAGREDLNNE